VDLDHEAPENPGTLVRRVDDGRFESYIHGRWEDHTPSLLWITMAPDWVTPSGSLTSRRGASCGTSALVSGRSVPKPRPVYLTRITLPTSASA